MKSTYLISIIGLLFFTSCNKKEIRHKAEIRPIVEAVYAAGKILPTSGHKLFSLNDGVILEQKIEEGTEVKKGQIIFVMDYTNQQSKQNTASETYRMAIENYEKGSPILSEAKTQVESTRNKLLNDSINFERYKSLWADNVGTKSDFEKASLAFKNSKNEYQIALKRLNRTRNQLFIDLQNAKTQRDFADKDFSNTLVKADMDGELFEAYKKQGEAVRRNDPVAYIGSKNDCYLQLWIDEDDIRKVKPGQKAFITIDINKSLTYEAVISKIYPTLNAENQSVRVDARFTKTPPDWIANASAEANIIISEKNEALTIPQSLLINNDSVWIESATGIEKIKVSKGIETIDYVEIIGGLDANTILIEK